VLEVQSWGQRYAGHGDDIEISDEQANGLFHLDAGDEEFIAGHHFCGLFCGDGAGGCVGQAAESEAYMG
jgi:hypothetical protein